MTVYQALLIKPMQSSHIIAVGMKRDDLKRLPEIEELAASIAPLKICTSLPRPMGIGCYLATGGNYLF
ncbi:MAG: hypothetical protein WDN75_20440 [Bacteroidota bacterium]